MSRTPPARPCPRTISSPACADPTVRPGPVGRRKLRMHDVRCLLRPVSSSGTRAIPSTPCSATPRPTLTDSPIGPDRCRGGQRSAALTAACRPAASGQSSVRSVKVETGHPVPGLLAGSAGLRQDHADRHRGEGRDQSGVTATQGVKLTARCEDCGGELVRDAGQFIDRADFSGVSKRAARAVRPGGARRVRGRLPMRSGRLC